VLIDNVSKGRGDEAVGAATGAAVRRSLPARVREVIEERILDGALREGDQIVEYQLARQLGISQTPVREALRRLEHDGLVVTRPHRGTFVRRVTRREASERYSLGMELEAFAARLVMPRLTGEDYRTLEGIIDEMSLAAAAAQRGLAGTDGATDDQAAGEAFARSVELNTAFHRSIVERTGHAQLLKAWLAVNPLNWRFVTYTRLLNPRPVELAERHRTLLEVFRRGDQVLAAAAIRQHIWEVAEQVLPNIPEEDDPPPECPGG
jgi:DNA-binding GntR family transcriptional regulator